MRNRFLLAAVPVAVLVLTGCGGGDDAPAGATSTGSASTPASSTAAAPDGSAELEAAVATMCTQVDLFLDNSEAQAAAGGQPFDRAAQGQAFLDQVRSNSAVWVDSFNANAEAMGEQPLDPATATWDDMPEQARGLIERSVEKGVAGSC